MEALKAATASHRQKYADLTNDLLNLAGILEQYATKMKKHDESVKQSIGA